MNRISINLEKCTSIYGYKEIYGKEDQFEYVKNLGHRDMIYHSLCIPLFIIKSNGNYTFKLLFDKTGYTEHYLFDESLGWVDVNNVETDGDETDGDETDDDETDGDTDTSTDTDSINTDTELNLDNYDTTISSVRFLNIEYTHPSLESPIYLQLPQNICIGSHILSSVFIVRLLEYTVGETYTFDMDYKLNIIDENIQSFSLLSNQYIKLYENDYKIKEIIN
jgi:hypothetical protein